MKNLPICKCNRSNV